MHATWDWTLKGAIVWIVRAVQPSLGRILLVSRDPDEVVLAIQETPPEVVKATSRQGSPENRTTQRAPSIRIAGRRLTVRGHRPSPWNAPIGAARARLGAVSVAKWLSRPFAASFALPFDGGAWRVQRAMKDGEVEIRVRRKSTCTPLA